MWSVQSDESLPSTIGTTPAPTTSCEHPRTCRGSARQNATWGAAFRGAETCCYSRDHSSHGDVNFYTDSECKRTCAHEPIRPDLRPSAAAELDLWSILLRGHHYHSGIRSFTRAELATDGLDRGGRDRQAEATGRDPRPREAPRRQAPLGARYGVQLTVRLRASR